MFHRFIYRIHNDLREIPEGYEINHKCKNRACCNPSHLEMLTVAEHRFKDSNLRVVKEKDKAEAKKLWMSSRCTGKEIAERLNVSNSLACRWIRKWKKEKY